MINERIWKKLEKAILAAKHSQAGAPGQMSDRAFFEALLYLNRTGTPWRDLPAEFGAWKTIYMRFNRWAKRGVWHRLWEELRKEPFAGARDLLMDSTTVRAHPHAAGALKKTEVARLWDGLAGDLARKSTLPPSTKTLP
jgi:transposase